MGTNHASGGDEVRELWSRCKAQQAEIERLRVENASLRERNETGCASAHVLVEAGVIPGIDPPCRCDECRLVARKMDEAGYLDYVKDRWWEQAKAGGDGG